MNKLRILATSAVLAILVGCSNPQTQSTSPVQSPLPAATSATPSGSTSLSEVDAKKAQALATQVKDGVFPYAEQNKKENAKIFLFLASTSDNEQVVIAALDGMAKTWTGAAGNAQKEPINEDYRAALLKLLESDSNRVLANALEAAKPALLGQTEVSALQEKLIGLADNHKEAGARLEALNALSGFKDFQQNEKIASVFLKNLDAPEAHLKSLALFRIQFNNYKLAHHDEFYAKAKSLMKDSNPGVRGRAAEVCSVLVPESEKQALGASITEMLGDKEAYVRSASADALGRLGYKPAVPKLMLLLEDKSRNTYEIEYTRLNGLAGSEHHDGSAWSRVDDSILWSLSQLTFEMGEQKFPYGKINWKNVDGDVAREVKLAKAWYEKNKNSLK